MNERFDSLDKYYKVIKNLSKLTPMLFWINSALSIAVFFFNNFPIAKDILLYVFISTTLAYFVIENYLSIVSIPQVEDKRRGHLLTNSFNVPLDNERTNKYYNNNLEPSLLKLSANVFENSLFAERVTREMVKRERIKIIILVLIFITAAIIRTTDLEVLSILAQILFASTIIPAYLRLRILHFKNKALYDDLYNIFLFHNGSNNDDDNEKLLVKLLDCFVKYEVAKAYSGVQQDSKIFHKINPEVSQEWEAIKRNLNIDAI